MTDTERFRQEAENCLRLEAETLETTDREALLWMAKEWLKLAQEAEYLSNSSC
jgi:hypothetical protein